MKNNQIKIVIADDHPLLLRGLRYSLEYDEGYEIIGEAVNGEKAFETILKLTPDIAVLDYDMPLMNGLEVLRLIRKENLATKVIFLTMHQQKDVFLKAMSLKADGFLLKESIDSEIVKAIQVVHKGGKYFDPRMSGYLLEKTETEKAEPNEFMSLTKMEMKVLKMVAINKKTKEIADELFISERTVDRHRSNICKKLDISGSNALMHFVIENKELLK